MTNFRDQLTYADLGGQRKARRYVIAAVAVLVLVVGIFGWSWFRRAQIWSEVLGTSQPLLGDLLASTHALGEHLVPSSLGNLSSAPQNGGSMGSLRPTGGDVSLPTCPTDPELWRLIEVFPGINYKRIEPPCVYAGLSKKVAWYLLTYMGYSGAEAAGMLDFEGLPQGAYIKSIKGMTATKGPQEVPISVEPFHPGLQRWSLTEESYPALTLSLRGCYRTRTISGFQVEDWGTGYPIICTVAVDHEAVWAGYRLGQHIYFNKAESEGVTRGFLLLGYLGDDFWELIGQHKDLWATLEVVEASQDREFYASQYGSTVWNAAWLEDTYGITLNALPAGWQSYDDPIEIQAIAEKLNEKGFP